MASAIIIGAGPAGISAGLYLHRGLPAADIRILTKGAGTGSLAQAGLIENYYGLEAPISGAELERRGRAGAERLGLTIAEREVFGLRLNDKVDGFLVETDKDTMEADVVIMATGAAREKPLGLPGLEELTGHGVSYCAICDAFFYRGKPVGVLGAGDYALHELGVLLPIAGEVSLFTNGAPAPADVPAGVTVYTEPLQALTPAPDTTPHRLAAVELTSGQTVPLAGLFIALGTAGSTILARKAGALLTDDGRSVRVDEHMATNIPGLFAAGDSTGGLLQVAKAVYEGAEAGLAAVRYLRQKSRPQSST